MLDFLFHLCIAPLESAMDTALHGAFSLTGSWGVSLVLLSLLVNTALIPIYHLAETWQEAERAAQRKMAPKLAEFKEVFSGRERYMYTRALYRLHDYSPVYALRTSFGLLIQVPFFFAAYHLLNAAPELAGSSWLFLPDLSKPDGLLALGNSSVNLLPFAMTAVNLLSAAVYASRLVRREKIQLYGLAALFLVLLYPSSAALLVYWTCNNLFSLAKNLVYTRFIYKDSAERNTTTPPSALSTISDTACPLARFSGKAFFPAWSDLALAALAILAFALAIVLRKRMGVNANVLALSLAGMILAGGCLAARLNTLRRREDIARDYAIFPLLIACIVTLCVWKLTSFKKINAPLPWVFFRLYAVTIGLLAGWSVARQPLLNLFCRAASFAHKHLSRKDAGTLFTASAFTLAALVCWYTPAMLYASDPDFFYEPFAVLAGKVTFRGVAFLLVSGLIFHWCRSRIKPFMALAWSWAALAALLFNFVATGDYGTMDEFILQDPGLLKTRLAIVVDLAVAAVACLILWFAIHKYKTRALAVVLQGACFALCLMTAYQALPAPANVNASLEEATTRLPDYNDELFGFSRTGKNTLVVMLDMFTGGHMERILDSAPELKKSLDGFVWYPDTISPGATTLLSIGALLGGEDYTPPAVNARKIPSLKEELHKAFVTLPGIFGSRGYSVALADVDELVPSLFDTMCPSPGQGQTRPLVVGKSLVTAYTGYWREKNNLPSPLPETRAPFIASVGLFRAAPWTLRDHIYYDGSWLGTQTLIHNPSEGPYAMLDVLPDVANANRTNNTLKYITSQVAHYPWRLDSATCMPIERKGPYTVGKDRVIEEHVINERCGMLALTRWFDWMKREGVYDNTQIILISDHDGNDSASFGKNFNRLRRGNIPWKPHALLLVKQRNNRGKLHTDNRPMSSADVVPLICAADGPCPGITYPNPLQNGEPSRVRTHSSGMASIRRHGDDHFKTTDYRVTGSMFDPENWEMMEKRP